MDLNKVTLIGNVVRDPEAKALANGQQIVRFSLATSYAWQDAATKANKESVHFHDCLAWGRLGDVIRQYVKRGAKVYIEGRLRKRRVAAHGQPRFVTEIVADNLIMLGVRTRSDASRVNGRLAREDVDVNAAEEGG